MKQQQQSSAEMLVQHNSRYVGISLSVFSVFLKLPLSVPFLLICSSSSSFLPYMSGPMRGPYMGSIMARVPTKHTWIKSSRASWTKVQNRPHQFTPPSLKNESNQPRESFSSNLIAGFAMFTFQQEWIQRYSLKYGWGRQEEYGHTCPRGRGILHSGKSMEYWSFF